MRAPDFWYRPDGAVSRILSPLGALYGWATAHRLGRAHPNARGQAVSVPVICVGNIDVGGSGKTPTVIAVIEMLGARGVNAHVISHGYGGRASDPLRVDPRKHTAQDVGDEALLLAAFGPVWVAQDRAAAARAAIADGAGAIVLDDGFQDPSLAASLSIVVVDATRGFGNARCIPAGPLREPVAAGLGRADVLLSVGSPRAQGVFGDQWRASIKAAGVAHVTGRLDPLQTGMDWRETPFLAFAGIGNPAKFFATLRGLGAELVHAEGLADHQPLTPSLMARLERDAARHGAQLVTTEKDAVRLPSSWRQKVITLPVRLRLDDAAPINDAFARVFNASGPG